MRDVINEYEAAQAAAMRACKECGQGLQSKF